jgi:D-sedoheptulose 7-phosphate isomerase
MGMISRYISDLISVLGKIPSDEVEEVVDIIMEAREKGKRVFIMGNGGSAATSSHFANDLSKGVSASGHRGVAAIALTDNVPLITAWANDSSYDDIFVEQLKPLLSEGDVVIGISGSGRSRNVLKAISYANEVGAITIGFSGYDGGELARVVRKSVVIPDDCMERIEDSHLILGHAIASAIRERLRSG